MTMPDEIKASNFPWKACSTMCRCLDERVFLFLSNWRKWWLYSLGSKITCIAIFFDVMPVSRGLRNITFNRRDNKLFRCKAFGSLVVSIWRRFGLKIKWGSVVCIASWLPACGQCFWIKPDRLWHYHIHPYGVRRIQLVYLNVLMECLHGWPGFSVGDVVVLLH